MKIIFKSISIPLHHQYVTCMFQMTKKYKFQMLSNDNAFLNTYASTHNSTKTLNPFDQRTLFARFKVNTNNASGTKYIVL